MDVHDNLELNLLLQVVSGPEEEDVTWLPVTHRALITGCSYDVHAVTLGVLVADCA
jgi:hypothetical protein